MLRRGMQIQGTYRRHVLRPKMSLSLPFMSWNEVFAMRKDVPGDGQYSGGAPAGRLLN